jgi:AraC-like DNA-binding protein
MPELAERTRFLQGQAGGSRFELAVRRPVDRLRPYVCGDYLGYTERTMGLVKRRELPGPFVVVVIEFGSPLRIYEGGSTTQSARYPGGFVAGLDDRFTLTESWGVQQGIQVNLTPVGARRFFGMPQSELTGRVVSIRDLLPRTHRELGDRIPELPDWDARFDLVEDLLGERIALARIETDVVSWGVRRIEESGGTTDMRSLARELGYSHKHMIGMFRDQVGMPPKRLARIVRFDRLVQYLKRAGNGTWADLALQFGYYDQAHLVREVKAFTGLTPTQVRPSLVDLFGLST